MKAAHDQTGALASEAGRLAEALAEQERATFRKLAALMERHASEETAAAAIHPVTSAARARFIGRAEMARVYAEGIRAGLGE
jgi:hypothetical protein